MWLSLRIGGSNLPERWLIAHWTGGSAAMEYPSKLLLKFHMIGPLQSNDNQVKLKPNTADTF
jgi:hypothetical protein